VNDEAIINWANEHVQSKGDDAVLSFVFARQISQLICKHHLGRTSRMTSFKDASLSTSLFFLDLLWSIEPRVIDWNLVTPGSTKEVRKASTFWRDSRFKSILTVS